MYIEQVNSPQDIKQFSAEQLRQLAGEVRNALLTKLSAHWSSDPAPKIQRG